MEDSEKNTKKKILDPIFNKLYVLYLLLTRT
jgi:hypothetical protein